MQMLGEKDNPLKSEELEFKENRYLMTPNQSIPSLEAHFNTVMKMMSAHTKSGELGMVGLMRPS